MEPQEIETKHLRWITEICADGTEIRWVQEEPSNMGAWRYLRAHTWDGVLGKMRLVCVSREESASPATGSGASHKIEQARLVAATGR